MIGKRRALGRGLAALIPEAAGTPAPPTAAKVSLGPEAASAAASAGTNGASHAAPALPPRTSGLFLIGIEEVHPGPHQPRKTFDDERLTELAESIRTQGIIQPLVVRKSPSGAGYELIAGERRWRAAQRAGLHEVPVVVREVAEREAFEMALVENLQRADLNPIEEAEGYQRLFAEFGYTQEALADRVGKDRSTIANALRLLKLPGSVREMVVSGRLAMGHARALLGLDSDAAIERVARMTVAKDLSVRQVEALVRKERQDGGGEAAKPAPAGPSAAARDLAQRLERAFGTRVRVIEEDATKGKLEIQYHSLDQLDGILEKIQGV